MDSLLIEEVKELTSFIRSSGKWGDVRTLIRAGGFDPDAVLLASFLEGENAEEWGVLVTEQMQVFEWFRNTDNQSTPTHWKEITNEPQLTDRYPQVLVAFALLSKRP